MVKLKFLENRKTVYSNFNGSGYITKLSGEARVPLDVSVFEGGFGPVTGFTIPNFSILHPADGELGRLAKGTSELLLNYWRRISINNWWSIRDCCIQSRREANALLFMIVKQYHKQSYFGEGSLFTLQTAVERVVYE